MSKGGAELATHKPQKATGPRISHSAAPLSLCLMRVAFECVELISAVENDEPAASVRPEARSVMSNQR